VPAGWRAAVCCARGCAGSSRRWPSGCAAVRPFAGPAGRLRRSVFPPRVRWGYARIRERHGAVFHREPAHNCRMGGYAAVTGGGWCRSRAARPELPEGGSGRPGGGYGFRALTARSRSCSCWPGRHGPGVGPACLDRPRPAVMSGQPRRRRRSLPGRARRGVPAAWAFLAAAAVPEAAGGAGAPDGGLENGASAAAAGI
jgi:hypothetical protein